MQHFRRADPVEDLAAEVRAESLANRLGQRFAGGRADAQRNLLARGQASMFAYSVGTP